MNSVRVLMTLAAAFGTLGVCIGAFGAHQLGPYLKSIDRVNAFEKAVLYQFFHTFAILAVGILLHLFGHRAFYYAGCFFAGGIVVFSGSLYMLCATNVRIWGAVTPVGGLLMIAGWICMFVGALKLGAK